MTITVDGKQMEVPEQDQDENLLTVLLHLGIDVPYFCWHPALGSVGACRQCAVKSYRGEADTDGRIVMACMTAVREGMRISVDDPEAVAFRRRVIEWLMVNHPHDCPVCDEGGECHLQDMVAMAGHVYRRYRGRKRTYRNQDLGPFIDHEMNRCIQCYRCLRFYRDYAGGRDLEAFASRDQVYFGRFEDGKLASEFSGNLVEVCPTGVFTDKTLKAHYARKWDLETAPSVCVHCGLGCNIFPGARYGMLRRIYPRFHPEVNRYFICDRGRFGYEFVNDPERLRRPAVGREQRRAADWQEATGLAIEALAGCRRVVGVGSPRASLEANFALQTLVGEDAFSPGLAAAEHAGLAEALSVLRERPVRSAALAEVESCDAVLVLGADPTNESPMLDLAIRQAVHRARLDASRRLRIPDWDDLAVRSAVQEEPGGALYIAAAGASKLDAIATEALHAAPPDLRALGFEIADQAAVETGDPGTLAGRVAQALTRAKRPLVVVSAGGDRGLLRAAASIATAVSTRRGDPCLLALVVPECNSVGVTMLGGTSLESVLGQIEAGEADGLIVLENDLFRRAPAARAAGALQRLRCLIALDHLPTETTKAADVVLPAAVFAETSGTLVNNEARAQRYHQVFVPQAEPRPSWRVLRDLIEGMRPGAAPWDSAESIARTMARLRPEFTPALQAAETSGWRDRAGRKIARESFRYTGRTAKDAHRTVFEPQPPADPGSPFAFSMEGAQAHLPPALLPRYWHPGWNSMQALYRHPLGSAMRARDQMPGRRRLEPAGGIQGINQPLEPERVLADNEMWIVPRAAIFGSEELSRRAPGVASVTPPATLRIRPEDAAKLSVIEGRPARFTVEGTSYVLPVELDPGLPHGVAAVPAGYPETAGIFAPCGARIEKAP